MNHTNRHTLDSVVFYIRRPEWLSRILLVQEPDKSNIFAIQLQPAIYHPKVRQSWAFHTPTQILNDKPLSENQFLTRLLEASVDGILAFDRDCRYIAWNQAMERISGVRREDVLGKNAFVVFPFLRETGEDKCLLAALAGTNSVSDKRPYTIPETGREGFFRGY